jgi:adenylylsulfate kinase
MHFEDTTRSLTKAVSYRIAASLWTAGLMKLLTGSWSLALFAGGADAVSKAVFYFFHERLWNRILTGRHQRRPAVVWLTGLSGAGKTTLANAVKSRLEGQGFRVEHLDGDGIRDIFPSTGFSRKDRDEHVKRVGYLASRLERHGVVVLASFVSPFEAARNFVRSLCQHFVEVHVTTSLEVCEARDPKGLYRRARQGLLREFTGIDSPYEAPNKPELRIDMGEVTPDAAAALVVARILKSKERPHESARRARGDEYPYHAGGVPEL